MIDALAFLGKGRRPATPELYGHDAETLLEEMDHKGVREAVVHHNLSWLSHPFDGNAETMRLIAGKPRLRPCWALLSKASREYGSYEAYIEEAVAQGVRAFSFFPRFGALPAAYDTSVREAVRAGTFAPLEERGLPLFIDFAGDPGAGVDCTDYEALRFLLGAHPRLPVILCEYRLRAGNRVFPGVMDDHPNLHLETSGLWNYRSLEFVAHHWGAERLIYGSRTPWRSTGLALGMVTMAALTARERALILAGNIRRLMEGAR
ncbi:MAG TPA: amidohydrolase family protein [Armatimonadetes bacterium]|nr:amidohydrolase family protein [Armatimonadota bacterium]